MFAFVAYAVLVWYLALRYRRRWGGFGCVVLGLLGVALVAYFHICLNDWTRGEIYLPVLQVLLYPYGVLLGMVGFFMAALPVRRKTACRACGFELVGLESENPRCPECGLEHAARPTRHGSCRVCGIELQEHEAAERLCEACGVEVNEVAGSAPQPGERVRMFMKEKAAAEAEPLVRARAS